MRISPYGEKFRYSGTPRTSSPTGLRIYECSWVIPRCTSNLVGEDIILPHPRPIIWRRMMRQILSNTVGAIIDRPHPRPIMRWRTMFKISSNPVGGGAHDAPFVRRGFVARATDGRPYGFAGYPTMYIEPCRDKPPDCPHPRPTMRRNFVKTGLPNYLAARGCEFALQTSRDVVPYGFDLIPS